VKPGNTIALIGGNINFSGGILTAPDGRIEIGSVSEGKIGINSSSKNWKFDYSSIQQFKDIQLDKLSLLDTSGSGNINLQAGKVTLLGGSYVLSQSAGSLSPGDISVTATKSLNIIGNTSTFGLDNPLSPAKVRTGIVSQVSSGRGANISILTNDLFLQLSGGVTSYANPSGTGGNISIKSLNSIQIRGYSPIDPVNNTNVIGTVSSGNANSGNIDISTLNLQIQNGGSIATATFGLGNSGDLRINALKKIYLDGINPVTLGPSAVITLTLGAGNSGNLNINTQQLTISSGGGVASSTQGFGGSAGNVIINASDFIDVSGTARGSLPGLVFPSFILASGNKIDPVVAQLFGVSSIPTASSGNITINTNRLSVTNGGQVTVKNDGTGAAGVLRINAGAILLDSQGSITAATASNRGGNIFLNAQNLQLRNSSISATATSGNGNGGNITINTDTLLATQNSKVTARANNGNGGHITVKTQGLVTDQGFFSLSNKPSDLCECSHHQTKFGVSFSTNPAIA